MTEAASTFRAVARVGAPPQAAAGPPVIAARSRPGYLGTVSLTRLLLVEAALVLPVATIKRPLWIVAAVVAGCAVVVVLALGRRKGRWWTERWAMSRRYRQRQALAPDRTADRRLRALHALAPDLRVANVAGADGAPVGIGTDAAGWYAIAALVPTSGLRGDVVTDVPLGRLARLIADSGQPGALVQVVLHSMPTPTSVLDPRGLCSASYQELLDRYGAMPANQTMWITVRLDARTLAKVTVGGHDESAQAPAVVAGLIRRVSRALHRAGVDTQVLDADGMLDALAYSCALSPAPDRGGDSGVREDRPVWHSGSLAQTCYWVRTWPRPEAAGELLRVLSASARASFTSVALVLEPAEDGVAMQCLTRVAAAPDLLAASCRTLTEAAGQAGAELLRLDGEQAPAVYATAPTGGGAR